jgi:hypothetical protein
MSLNYSSFSLTGFILSPRIASSSQYPTPLKVKGVTLPPAAGESFWLTAHINAQVQMVYPLADPIAIGP